ncbi:uncharacterized protein N7459_009942 [Penicillium hispanicum]|uniref:uncharacterized protein n=1 Tax=Penicillium hispanicum TaxID=1080232 RepID=UPI0025420A6E|nr:uncharacterized protein N7459_009942 [Penicillium hispanicum]KAJ5570512.1 hypothetical protein N7459_009942 [Penicillium hispanicum]
MITDGVVRWTATPLPTPSIFGRTTCRVGFSAALTSLTFTRCPSPFTWVHRAGSARYRVTTVSMGTDSSPADSSTSRLASPRAEAPPSRTLVQATSRANNQPNTRVGLCVIAAVSARPNQPSSVTTRRESVRDV